MDRHQPPITFLGAALLDDVTVTDADFVFLGIPYTSPYEMRGHRGPSADAPDAVRLAAHEFEYHKLLEHYDFDCEGVVLPAGTTLGDAGDVPCVADRLDQARREATEAVRGIVASGAIPLIVGGDDAIPPIVAAGFDGGTAVHVLHIDAHLDFRDEVGGVHNGYSSPMRRLRELPHIGEIVQVGLRGIGSARPAEVAAARAAGNGLISADELHGLGAERVLDSLPDDRPWFVTIDCDGLDPSVAPGVEWPEPDGVTYGEAAILVRGLARAGRIAAIEFTEYAPRHDIRSLTALAICRLLMNVISLAPSRAYRDGAASAPSERAALSLSDLRQVR